MVTSNKQAPQRWALLDSSVAAEISRYYTERLSLFVPMAALLSLVVTIYDMLPRLAGWGSPDLMTKAYYNYFNLAYTLVYLVFTFVLFRIKREAAAAERYGFPAGVAFVIVSIVYGLSLMMLTSTIPIPDIFLLIIILSTPGIVPLPSLVLHPVITTGFLTAALLINLGQTSHASPLLSTLILLVAVVIAAAIGTSNFHHLNGMISNRHQLEEIRRKQDSFFSLLAHDLRNPIGVVPGILEMHMDELTKAGAMTSKRRELLDLLMSYTLNTFHLLEDLLRWGGTRSESVDCQAVPVDMPELVLSTLENFTPLFHSKSLAIESSFGPVPPICSSPEHLKTILRNIIGNAVKYSPPGGRIRVSLASRGEETLEMTVADNGVGMDSADIERILAGKSGDSRPGSQGEKGSGLGMSLVMELMREIDADLEIESVPGAGTSVSVLLKSKPE